MTKCIMHEWLVVHLFRLYDFAIHITAYLQFFYICFLFISEAFNFFVLAVLE